MVVIGSANQRTPQIRLNQSELDGSWTGDMVFLIRHLFQVAELGRRHAEASAEPQSAPLKALPKCEGQCISGGIPFFEMHCRLFFIKKSGSV